MPHVLLSVPESVQTRAVSQHVCIVSMHSCSGTPTPWLTTGKTALGGSAAPPVRPGGAQPAIEQEPLAGICWDGHGQVISWPDYPKQVFDMPIGLVSNGLRASNSISHLFNQMLQQWG